MATVVSAAVLAGLLIVGAGRGHPTQYIRLLSGAAWLPSSQVGQITLLDGSSAEVAAQLQVARRGNDLQVVQQGSTAYVIDRSEGTIRRVNGATFELTPPGSPIPDARAGLTAFASPDTLYAFDAQRGLLADTDPETLARRGQPLSMAAQLSTGSAALDDAGRLWLVDNATGDLTSIAGGRRDTRRGVTEPGQSVLTLAAGQPVIVNGTNRTAVVIDPESGTIRGTIELDLRAEDVIQVSGSSHDQRLYVVASRGVLAICDLLATSCDNAIPLDAGGDDLGAAVEAGNRLFIPDYTTGQVWIVDLAGGGVVAQPEVLNPPAPFQLLTRDGIVFYNDPDSERAGVIDVDGAVVPTAKYDPKDPDKGLRGPVTPTSTPPPTSAPPTSAPPSTTPPTTVPPPPTSNPATTRAQPPPPTAVPPPTGPPTSQAPPSTAPPSTSVPLPTTSIPPPQPTLQITLSKINPQVDEDVTLQVSNTTGSAPTSASWSFGDGAMGTGITTSHRWATARTYQVSVQATMPGGQQATTSVSVVVNPLPAPSQISPADGTVFNTGFPRTTTLTWNAVPGAAQYFVEAACLHCEQLNQWTVWWSNTQTGTSFTFGFVGAQPGRWRVTAISAAGDRSAPSPWWYFTYTL